MEVPLSWQLAKLAVSIGIVLGLSLVAERVSTRIAGLLAGYPLGTAIALFFIGLEIAPAFAAESAVFSLAGFTATMALGGGYLVCGRRDGLRGVLAGTASGLVAWWITSLVLTSFEFNRISGTLVTLMAIFGFTWLYRHVPEVRITARAGGQRWPALAMRAGLATLIVFIVTGLAHVVPASWAGMLAAFPISMYPLLVILHLTHGAAPAATIIKHYPAGLGSLLSYTLCVSLTYATLGLLWGTLLGFVVATLWLLGWMRLQTWQSARQTART